MRKALKRPDGWGQQAVLDALDEGLNLKELTARYADGAPCAASSLMKDIDKWRARDENFSLHVEDLLKRQTGTVKIEGKTGRTKLTPDRKEALLIALEQHGGKVDDACREVGVSFSAVYAHLRPGSSQYDAFFAERYLTLEAERFNTFREKYIAIALDEKVDVRVREKALQFLLKTGLPTLHSERQQVEISGTVSHTHRVLPAALVQEARRFGQQAIARANADESRMLSDVVEGEIVQ